MNEEIRSEVERALRDARMAQAEAYRALRDKQRAHEDALRALGQSIAEGVDMDEQPTPEPDDESYEEGIEGGVETPAPDAVEIDAPSDQDDAAIRRAVQEARRIRIETQQGSAQ